MTEHPRSYAPAGVGRSPELAARPETYLEAGRRGKNSWWRYLLGVVFILFMWFVVGGRASLALGNVLGISLKDGTLELAIGAHAANNLFGAIVLSFEGSALKTPSLFYTDRFVPAHSLIQFVVAAALFYVVVFVLFKRRAKKVP